jgi:hypothetical protein
MSQFRVIARPIARSAASQWGFAAAAMAASGHV